MIDRYDGWHGVTDHLFILMAVSFEPVDGLLCCKFRTGEPVVFAGVPEAVYQSLLRNKFAGSYFRKHIRGKYPCPFESELSPYQPKEKLPEKKLIRPEIPKATKPQMDLWVSLG